MASHRAEPLPPRRRLRLLIIITVVALLPALIGFGIALLSGSSHGPTPGVGPAPTASTTPAGR